MRTKAETKRSRSPLALAIRIGPRVFEALTPDGSGKHPIEMAGERLPEIRNLVRRLRRLNARVGRRVKDRHLFIAQQDAEVTCRSLRHERYFDIGYHLGFTAGRSEPRLPSRAGRTLAKRVRTTILLSMLSREEATAVLLETLRVIVEQERHEH